MKKLLGIVVLGLLWCNVVFALSQETVIDKYLSKGKLDKVEGIWITHRGNIIAIYKIGNSYSTIVISDEYFSSGQNIGTLRKGSANTFYGDQQWTYLSSSGTIGGWSLYRITYTVSENVANVKISGPEGSGNRTFRRLWPENFSSYNAKFEKPKKKKIKKSPDDNKVVAAASGSGFIVSKSGDIITNHHVIDQCKTIKVNFKGSAVETKILAIDKVNDIAILKANIKPDKVYSVSNEDVSLLEDVVVAGFPLGKKVSSAIKTHKGVVTSLAGAGDNYSNFQTDASINQGNSGGPIINQKGNIVGIAVATWVEEGVQGVHFGIKSSTLKTFASANGLEFLPPNNRDLSNKELGQLITSGTVYLECHMTIAKIKKMIAEANNRKAFFSEYR